MQTFPVHNFEKVKQQLLAWGNQAGSCCFLDNHQYPSPWQRQECVLAAKVRHSITAPAGNALHQLQTFLNQHQGQWVFGHLGYGLKAETENVAAPFTDPIGFGDLYFFVPETVARLSPQEIIIENCHHNEAGVWEEIKAIDLSVTKASASIPSPQPRISKEQYFAIIEKLRQHILRGDCYEINFCQEFFAENAPIEPLTIYQRLSQLSPNPFCCYYKVNHAHLMCASPERYLMRNGDKIFSQPIKGTAARNLTNATDDAHRRQQLQASTKDRSENVMVVDLVRNDLSKICREGSVQVDELFGIYTYPHVHQMISTISGTLGPDVLFSDIIKASFPMGSMTGAPKKKVLELTDLYEPVGRGLFSGAVGYIAPDNGFDFNVVIRSLLYNAATHYLSYSVGGGITWYSQAEKEYEECLLKAAAIRQALAGI